MDTGPAISPGLFAFHLTSHSASGRGVGAVPGARDQIFAQCHVGGVEPPLVEGALDNDRLELG